MPTLSNGYCVMIATHFPLSNRETVKCGFSSAIRVYKGEGRITTLAPEVQEMVQGFIENGGEFICYLTGHTNTVLQSKRMICINYKTLEVLIER